MKAVSFSPVTGSVDVAGLNMITTGTMTGTATFERITVEAAAIIKTTEI